MAKQFGIHQIKGKVGDMSYYRQSGVSSGLIRSINPGMSSRVKTSPEYSNTRLNNEEFKVASAFAASVINGVSPRFRPMFNTFRNARYSADLLKLVKSATGNWGMRYIGKAHRQQVCDKLKLIAKNDFSQLARVELGSYADPTQEINIILSDAFTDTLSAIGADGCDFRIQNGIIYEGFKLSPSSELPQNITVLGEVADTGADLSENPGTSLLVEYDRTVEPELQYLTNHTDLQFYWIVALPYRMVNSVKHVLQEACSVMMLPDPENSAA